MILDEETTHKCLLCLDVVAKLMQGSQVEVMGIVAQHKFLNIANDILSLDDSFEKTNELLSLKL